MRAWMQGVLAAALACSALAAEPTPTPDPALAAFPAPVRQAVETARANAQAATETATRARDAGVRGEAAAQLAWGGATGTRVKKQADGKTYAQEWRISNRNGFGVVTFDVPSLGAGDRFAGQLAEADYTGLGVYTFAENPNNVALAERYEGEFLASRRSGLGVYRWKSGVVVAGKWLDDAQIEPAVVSYSDGRRYEGELAAMKPGGVGVMWQVGGRAVAGRWAAGQYLGPAAP